jgi:selenide,water dikinase
LAHVLRDLHTPDHPDLLVGYDTGDDAAVWRRPEGRALVSTADFFPPIVDDARLWGRISATNAASDVYAMGGIPLFALNLVAWPRDLLPLETLAEVMAGGSDAAADGGWIVAGGHTVDGPEPMYGMAVTGEVDPDRILTNAGGAAGQTLILTKPIGTGIVATALKWGEADDIHGDLGPSYDVAVAEMTRLNRLASEVALKAQSTCATDVTGFGLLGHLQKLAAASGLSAALDSRAVPRITGVDELAAAGKVPGGTGRNRDFVEPWLDGDAEATDLDVLADPQTSGGLIFACPSAAADDALAELHATGHTAAVVGELFEGPAGRIRLS